MDVRADSRQDWPPVLELWPLQGTAIHSLGVRGWGGGGTVSPTRVEARGVLLTEDPHPREPHPPLSQNRAKTGKGDEEERPGASGGLTRQPLPLPHPPPKV